MPFVVGWIIAMIANPLVRFFEQKIKIRRKAGSAIVIVAVLALVVCLGYLVIARLISEGAGFIADLPDIWKGLERDLNQVGANLTDFYARFPLEIRENLSVISEKLVQYIGGCHQWPECAYGYGGREFCKKYSLHSYRHHNVSVIFLFLCRRKG